jgi:hypothetical protein
VELDPKYVDTIILRWQAFSGSAAALESTGESWEQIVGARKPALSAAGR